MHAQAAAAARPMTGTPDARAVQAGQLVRQATGGDLDAFEELIRRVQRRVYGFAYHHVRDLDEAHDLTQEILITRAGPSGTCTTGLGGGRRGGGGAGGGFSPIGAGAGG